MRRILLLSLISILHIGFLRAQCTAAFTYTTNQNTATFYPAMTGPNVLHTWYFGDGGYAPASPYAGPVSFTFAYSGTYNVKHIVHDLSNNCYDSVTQAVPVIFTYSCNNTVIGYYIDSFAYNHYWFNLSSNPMGGYYNSANWTIDGVYASNDFGFWATLSPGTHTVCVTIGTTTGCTSTTCTSITVTAPQNCNWTSSFTYAASPSNSKLINFTASPQPGPYKYFWSFGDGTASWLANPSHLYQQAGTYHVSLRMVDTLTHCFDSTHQDIHVIANPCDTVTASFTATATGVPGQYQFTAYSNQPIVSQTWTFYDSSGVVTINSNNPLYTFNTGGDSAHIYVCLHVVTSSNCTATTCHYIGIVGARHSGNTVPSYPNPASDNVSVTLKLAAAERVSIRIYNARGFMVYAEEKQGNSGNNRIVIPVQRLQKGQYFIDMQYGNEKKRSTFLKL